MPLHPLTNLQTSLGNEYRFRGFCSRNILRNNMKDES